jgi:hypothetical protein
LALAVGAAGATVLFPVASASAARAVIVAAVKMARTAAQTHPRQRVIIGGENTVTILA